MYELVEGQSGDYWLFDCQKLTDVLIINQLLQLKSQ